MKRIAFKTFGCKANSVDTDFLTAEAARRGFQLVDEAEVADAYVINSCTVTHSADRDARSHVLRYKRRNPEALVGVVGCYAQVAPQELLDLQQVDFVVGTANKTRVLDSIAEAFATAQPGERNLVEEPKGYLPEIFLGSRNARASIKVQDGCNYKCAFCIIPDARGRSRSLPMEQVVAQVREATAQGFREVVLTGIHLAHYGWDHGTDLAALVKRLIAEPDGPRIRVSSLDPFEIPDELIELVKDEPKFCPHFHIAVQSGSDRTLARMRRIYKAAEFDAVAEKIHARNPDTFIGLDVIVGFPGETDDDFEETYRQLERTFWAKAHVFPYSDRAGTRGSAMDDKVPKEVSMERSARLRALSDKRLEAFHQSQMGKQKQVILERPSKQHARRWYGHTENYLATISTIPPGASEKQLVTSLVTAMHHDRVLTTPVA